MPTDKAGTAIVVGCRVREADFGFGDGTVKSITVPVHGCDGFNVGVDWDDSSMGGPAWSTDGGGRAGEHLLVLEAAAAPAAAEEEAAAEPMAALADAANAPSGGGDRGAAWRDSVLGVWR